MINQLNGVRYIGKKALQEDTVCNTKATWVIGQVNNFTAPLAKRLFEHTDSFEYAEVDPNANSYFGQQNFAEIQEPVAFVNLSTMDAVQLAGYAKLNYNKDVQLAGRDIETVRSEVYAHMTNNNLDLEAEAQAKALEGGHIAQKVLTAEEYAELQKGHMELRLVPVVREYPVLIKTPEQLADPNHIPTLSELVTKLSHKELVKLAKQENVPIKATMSSDALRAALLDTLGKRTYE